MTLSKTILKGKNSKKEPLFTVILSGEADFSVSASKTLSQRRQEEGFVYTDTVTIEQTKISIRGVISDIPTLIANLEQLPSSELKKRDNIYRGIVAGYYDDVADLIDSNPKKFSDDFRTILTEVMNTRDVVFDIHNPKDNNLIYNDYYLTNINVSELKESLWGFAYALEFASVIQTELERVANTEKVVTGNKRVSKVQAKPTKVKDGAVKKSSCEEIGVGGKDKNYGGVCRDKWLKGDV